MFLRLAFLVFAILVVLGSALAHARTPRVRSLHPVPVFRLSRSNSERTSGSHDKGVDRLPTTPALPKTGQGIIRQGNDIVNLPEQTLGSEVAKANSYWNHNGSSLKLEVDKTKRRFVYIEPREGLREVGVTQGTVAFEGRQAGPVYEGTAYVFSQRCGAIGYSVKGTVATDDQSITMKGYAPYVDSDCSRSGGRDGELFFELIDAATAAVVNDRAICFSQGPSSTELIAACEHLISTGNLSPADRYSAYMNRGNAWYASGDYDQAIVDFSVAIRINQNPQDPSAVVNRGLSWQLKGNCQYAIPDFSTAISLNPGLVFAYTNRGLCYEKTGQLGQAGNDYYSALALPTTGQGIGPGASSAQDTARKRLLELGSGPTVPPVATPSRGTPACQRFPNLC